MAIASNTAYFIVLMSIACVTQVAYVYYYRKKKHVKRAEVNEVIIFSHGSLSQKKSKYSRYVISPSMDRLLYYLNKPKHSIDICMYVITSQELGNAIVKLSYRGVKVRVIVDADMAFATGSVTRRMEKQGIPVRWMKSTNLMHHKFCLVDADIHDDTHLMPLVITGSLNWTNQALNSNWENVTVTSQKDLVRQYKVEYDRLWELFKPIVAHS